MDSIEETRAPVTVHRVLVQLWPGVLILVAISICTRGQVEIRRKARPLHQTRATIHLCACTHPGILALQHSPATWGGSPARLRHDRPSASRVPLRSKLLNVPSLCPQLSSPAAS